ncbi:MAG: hypothetical protein ABI599_03560 [Flavobacteriales bacterium]
MLDHIPLLQSSNMAQSTSMLIFAHSLLRWLVVISVGLAGFIALRGWLMNRPIIVWERMVAIVAVVMCHVQVVVGIILYSIRYKRYVPPAFTPREVVFWRYEHIAMMLLAVILVTVGRVMSKRAKTEPAKWKFIAIFYLIALLLMCLSIPWPHTEMGTNRGWL